MKYVMSLKDGDYITFNSDRTIIQLSDDLEMCDYFHIECIDGRSLLIDRKEIKIISEIK